MGLVFRYLCCSYKVFYFIGLDRGGNLVAFATKLEDYFHGKAAVDVLGVTSDECVSFQEDLQKKLSVAVASKILLDVYRARECNGKMHQKSAKFSSLINVTLQI